MIASAQQNLGRATEAIHWTLVSVGYVNFRSRAISGLEAQIAQAGMVIGPAPQRPVILAI